MLQDLTTADKTKLDSYPSTYKRQLTFTGTTNASGEYTVTFSPVFSATPNIQANIINGADNQNIRITSITASGFTVLARNRVGCHWTPSNLDQCKWSDGPCSGNQ